MKLIPKNWSDFQHYNKRTPPWIKLHRGLLDDFDYQRLPVASRAIAPMLWLLASEKDGGEFDASTDYLMFRLRCSEKDIIDGLKPLIDNGFFKVASGTLSSRYQDSPLETEGEGEEETEAKTEKRHTRARVQKPDEVSDQVWADWKRTRGATLTPTAWSRIEPQLNAGAEKGHSIDDMLATAVEAGWRGFKLEWYENRVASNSGESSTDRATREAIEYRRKQKEGSL